MHRLDIDYDQNLNFEEFCKALLMYEVDAELLKTQNLASIYTTLNYKSEAQETYYSLGKENHLMENPAGKD